jgi:mannose-6-phosphate isomerase-like protein (cupin superfamily)
MNKYNIFDNRPTHLGDIEDERGRITDIFYKANINHVVIISSLPNALRGNHYHARSTQHMYIVSGSLEYWYKNDQMPDSEFTLCTPGDVVTSERNEIHALKIGNEGCVFMAFTEGVRGGDDYESDTYRVENIIRQLN